MKKTIPLGIRKILEDLSQKYLELFEVVYEKDSVVVFIDLDKSSNFHFKIEKINHTNNDTSYIIAYTPSNELNFITARVNVKLEDFKSHFEKWRDLIIEFNKESLLFDDPIIQSYYDELNPEFLILDEDASYKPYSIFQQKKIIAFLDKSQEIIENENIKDKDIEATLELIQLTKKNISKSTKFEVTKNIRKIIAIGLKISLEVGQKLLIEFTSELTKKLILGN